MIQFGKHRHRNNNSKEKKQDHDHQIKKEIRLKHPDHKACAWIQQPKVVPEKKLVEIRPKPVKINRSPNRQYRKKGL